MTLIEINTYRVFVRHFLRLKNPKARGEIAKLASHLGVHPTFVSQVLAGNKDFNLEQGYAVTSYLNLSEVERNYFICLIQKDRAGTQELKDYFQDQLNAIRKSLLSTSNRLPKHRTLDDQQKAVFYSSWIYSAVRLFCSIGSGKTVEEVSEAFQIGRIKASEILNFLTETGLCILEGDRYRMGSQHTHLEATSPFVLRHHMNWRSKAMQRHENVSAKELILTAPFSISRKDFEKVREKILECVKENFEIIKSSPAEDVAFLNIDFLWLNWKE